MPKVQEGIRRLGFLKSLILVELSAILVALSMPGMVNASLAWFGLVPLFVALEGKKLWKSALYTWLFGMSLVAVGMYWLLFTLMNNISSFDGFPPSLGILAFALFVAIEGAYWMLFGLLYSLVSKGRDSPSYASLFSVAGAYVLMEYVRGIGELGFTGMRLSNPFYDRLGLLQLSSVTGTLGIVFVVVAVNYVFYISLRKKNTWYLVGGVSVVLISNLSSLLIPKNVPSSLRVGVVQPNVSVAQRYSMSDEEIFTQFEEALKFLDGKVRIVFFPEGTFEYEVNGTVSQRIFDTLKKYDMAAIIGFPTYRDSKIYNSVGLFTPAGLKGIYSKHILVPFTEALPYPRFFGMFKFLRLENFFTPGERYTVFNWKGHRFSVQICFESYFGWLSRKFVNKGANFLVTVTNDSWFSQRTALEQHFAQSVFRAVENRKWAVQVADTGITGVVDPYGRIRKKLKIHRKEEGVFLVGMNEKKTFYDRFGDWFVWIALALVVCAFERIRERR